jgi:8-oxo-dGTP pyrophosphatase MutT (NUDIX family)
VTGDRRVRELVEQLRQHVPGDAREARSRRDLLRYLVWLRQPFDADADPVHVTTSAIVLDPEDRVLLHRHKRLGTWLQPGGHVEGAETPERAVLREVREETGLALAHPGTARPLHVDVHEGGRGHLHLDLRYLLHAPAGAALAPAAGESGQVRWFGPSEAVSRGDVSLAAALRRAWTAGGGDGR